MTGGGAPDPAQIIRTRDYWRQWLARDYPRVTQRLVTSYQRTLARIEPSRAAIIRVLNEMDAEKALTPRRLSRVAEFAQFLDTTRTEMDSFAVILRDVMEDLQASSITAGTQSAAQMVRAGSGRLANIVMDRWVTPDPEMLRALINYVDSEAMRAKFAAFGANASQSLSDAMLALTAQGKGARSIADMLTAWDRVPYAWAENMARTVQQYSYRQATSLNYRANSDVVEGWVWYTALDDRVCPSCLAMHGTFHSNDEILNGHHQCRCVQIPKVTGSRWADEMETGEQWFARQPDSVQRGIMGKGMHAAYKAGDIDFGKLSTTYNDPVYGEMRRAATLKELVGER